MKKNSNQASKQILGIYPADSVAAEALDGSLTEAVNDQNLAELVWRHFQREITETLAEIQESLAPEEARSMRAKSQKDEGK